MSFIYERDKEKVNFVISHILMEDMVEMRLKFDEKSYKLVWKPGINDKTMDEYKKILNTLYNVYAYCVKSVYKELDIDDLYGPSTYCSRYRIELTRFLKNNVSSLKFANVRKVSQVYSVISYEDMVVISGLLYVASEDVLYKDRFGYPSDSYVTPTVAVIPRSIIDLIPITEEESNLDKLRSIVSYITSIINYATQKIFSERKDRLYQKIEQNKIELKELEEEFEKVTSIVQKFASKLQDDTSNTDTLYYIKKIEYYPGVDFPTNTTTLSDKFTTREDAFDYAETLATDEVNCLNDGARAGVSFGVPEDDEYQRKTTVKVQYYYEDNTELVTIYHIGVESDRKE